jgi:Flp pilus assembly protein TadG
VTKSDRGQGLVEFALAVPVLLLLLLGIADLGRAFYYSSAIAAAAHNGAAAYSANPNAAIQGSACAPLGSDCVATAVTSCPGAPANEAAVQVIYHLELVSGYIVGSRQLDLRACATYPAFAR